MARAYARSSVTITPTGRRQCETCGQRFDWVSPRPKGGGRPPRFCSTDCEKWRAIPCFVCATPVRKMAGRGSTRRPVCSSECRSALQWRMSMLPEDHPAIRMQRRRSQAMAKVKQAEMGSAGDRRFVAGICRRCGKSFVALGRAARTCSDACADGAAHDRRRARKRSAYVADVNRAAIYERDHWTCKLCGKKVRRTAGRHPLAPSIDHIIPLAAGGTHEPANCQLAHFSCNSRKSAGGWGEQLLLIG